MGEPILLHPLPHDIYEGNVEDLSGFVSRLNKKPWWSVRIRLDNGRRVWMYAPRALASWIPCPWRMGDRLTIMLGIHASQSYETNVVKSAYITPEEHYYGWRAV